MRNAVGRKRTRVYAATTSVASNKCTTPVTLARVWILPGPWTWDSLASI